MHVCIEMSLVSPVCGGYSGWEKRTQGAVFTTWRITSGRIRTSSQRARCSYSLFSSGTCCGGGYAERCLQHCTMRAYSITAYSYRTVKSLSGQGAVLILGRLNMRGCSDVLTDPCKKVLFIIGLLHIPLLTWTQLTDTISGLIIAADISLKGQIYFIDRETKNLRIFIYSIKYVQI